MLIKNVILCEILRFTQDDNHRGGKHEQSKCALWILRGLRETKNRDARNKNQKISHMKNANWKTILKIIITVLTALAGAIGVASCAR